MLKHVPENMRKRHKNVRNCGKNVKMLCDVVRSCANMRENVENMYIYIYIYRYLDVYDMWVRPSHILSPRLHRGW